MAILYIYPPDEPYLSGYDWDNVETSAPELYNAQENSVLMKEEKQTIIYYFIRAKEEVIIHY